jgi:hypothetical protein
LVAEKLEEDYMSQEDEIRQTQFENDVDFRSHLVSELKSALPLSVLFCQNTEIKV